MLIPHAHREMLNTLLKKLCDLPDIQETDCRHIHLTCYRQMKSGTAELIVQWKSKIGELFSSHERFEEKTNYLQLVDSLQQYPAIAALLPEPDLLRGQVRAEISRTVDAIEELIYRENGKGAEPQLNVMKSASVLDPWMDGEVTKQYERLLRLQESRYSQLDAGITRRIEECDLKGIQQFLQPFHESIYHRMHSSRINSNSTSSS